MGLNMYLLKLIYRRLGIDNYQYFEKRLSVADHTGTVS